MGSRTRRPTLSVILLRTCLAHGRRTRPRSTRRTPTQLPLICLHLRKSVALAVHGCKTCCLPQSQPCGACQRSQKCSRGVSFAARQYGLRVSLRQDAHACSKTRKCSSWELCCVFLIYLVSPQRNTRFGKSHWSIAHVLTRAHCCK